jgi:hypothetical protein
MWPVLAGDCCELTDSDHGCMINPDCFQVAPDRFATNSRMQIAFAHGFLGRTMK